MTAPESSTSGYLHRQFVAARAPRSRALAVIERLGALQAQIPTVPAVSLAARVEGLDPSAVARWLGEEKRLLRAWCLRGTVHVFRTEDLPLFYGAVMRDLQPEMDRILRKLYGTRPAQARAQDRRILRALEDGPRTRGDLAASGACSTLRWGLEIRGLAHRGLVVHAGMRGGEVVFDLLARWAPHADLGDLPTLEARRRLLLRYLAGYGPATVADFAHWMGIRVGAAAKVFEAARADLREAPGGAWCAKGDRDPARSGSCPPRLLPRFDPFVLAHRDKTHYLDEAHRRKVFRPAAVVEAVFLVDGRVAGTWTHRPHFSLRPFRPLPRPIRDALRAEYERLRPYLPAREAR